MRSAGLIRMRRVAASVVVAALVAGAHLPAALAAGQAGNVEIRGKVFDMQSGDPLADAVVHAVHLDTKEVYTSGPTSADGEYELDHLPFGYYDLAVESSGGLFLSNRVIRAPAGESIKISLILGEPQPEDTEWWSADPHRRIPGLDRTPDGVGRIVEGTPRRIPSAQPGSAAPGPTPASATASAGSRLDDPRRSWLIPTLVASGLFGLALLVEDDEDQTSDPPTSPF